MKRARGRTFYRRRRQIDTTFGKNLKLFTPDSWISELDHHISRANDGHLERSQGNWSWIGMFGHNWEEPSCICVRYLEFDST